MPAAEVDIRETEIDRITRWRADALERAGYDQRAAAKIAERHEVDLHKAVQLIEQGCPPELAPEILL